MQICEDGYAGRKPVEELTYDERTILMNVLWEMMTYLWGERCEEFEQDFSACQEWAHFDKTGQIME